MKARRGRFIRAFSLIEITLALGVGSFCLLAVLALLPVGTKTNQASIQSTKALAVAAQIMSDLRADVQLPPGQASKEQTSGFSLHGHWAAVSTPDSLYFTNEGKQTGTVNPGSAPADAVFVANIKYMLPPTQTTSIARITVAWPAPSGTINGQGDIDLTNVAGSIELFTAINR
jgi:uncharacterized protein (TIGR02598 family)